MSNLLFNRAIHPLTSSIGGKIRVTFSTSSILSFPLRQSFTTIAIEQQQQQRPFRILGLQQIAIGSLENSSLSHLWINILGVPKVGSFRSERENVEEEILRLGKDENLGVEVDLMMPIDPEKSPKVHIPPLNHIGLWVDDLPAAVKWMESQRVRFTPGGIRKGAAGYDVTFIHPKGNEESPVGGGGVLIELVQAPKNVIEALS